jgi:thiamine-monophosphate kinase
MSLKEIGEFGFIRKISKGCLIRPQNVLKGIGDDAAVFIQDHGAATLVTTDLLVEGIHFLRHHTSGFNLGYKALAVNLSDIAAMGGEAHEAFISIAVPDDCTEGYLKDLYKGIQTLAAEFEVNILGGDTTRSQKDLIINICIMGSAPQTAILYRHTAQLGDIVFSTGFLGDSRGGLYLLLNEIDLNTEELQTLVNALTFPRPLLREGRFLAGQSGVHAAIDVSDGLSSDIMHIASESHVGVRLHHEKIPVSKNLESFCNRFGFDPVEFALAGGDDYTLLCTIAENRADKIMDSYLGEFNRPLYPIGEITDSLQVEMIMSNGRIKILEREGWDHFKTSGDSITGLSGQ